MSTVLLLALAAVLVWGVVAFNRLVRLRNQMRAAWADIDVQLTRRHDLVPQLVTAVKGYASHERSTLESVTELRAEAARTADPTRLGEVERALEQGLARIFALREAYPDLKASETFLRLQRDLVEVEDHLQYARRFYNGAVREYRTACERVPDMLVARAFRFEPGAFFQADAPEREAPGVEMRP